MDTWKTKRDQATVLECGLKVLVIDNLNGKNHLMIWQPRALKPYFHYLVSPERTQEHIDAATKRFTEHQARKAEAKEKRKGSPEALAKIQVGSIFSCSWGWEQTNVDFYQVTEIKGRTLTLRQIASESVGQTSWASNNVIAQKDAFKGEPFKKLVQFLGNEYTPYLTLSSFETAFLWDGKPTHRSWWA
jgi:hypothetical protein